MLTCVALACNLLGFVYLSTINGALRKWFTAGHKMLLGANRILSDDVLTFKFSAKTFLAWNDDGVYWTEITEYLHASIWFVILC